MKKKVNKIFAYRITPNIEKKINNPGVQIQFIPDERELDIKDYELVDPIGDNSNSPTKGIVHRYPDRCLFKVVNVCPVYCRFCFRKELIGPKQKALTKEELKNCYEYLRSNKNIWEVILTGGDPLILKPKILKNIIAEIKKIPHIEVIRIHTRVPVVEPSRITDELISALKEFTPVYIVIHSNHPDEFDEENKQAIAKLAENGIPLLSQSVLLKNVNDNIETLSSLMKLFIKNRIKPYYLHHLDKAKGTSHFKVSIEKGNDLIEELRGRYSGICQPSYVIDIPGGYGKTPLVRTKVKKCEEHYLITDYQNKVHKYDER